MGWSPLFRRNADNLRPIEKLVLLAVAERLERDAKERFLQQLAMINMVQRHAGGKEVNLYSVRRGRVTFDDALRFPVTVPEVRLATLKLKGASVSRPVRSDIWLANGRVFSITFDRPQGQWASGAIDVEEVKLWIDPMKPEAGLRGTVQSDELTRWLGTIAEDRPIGEIAAPGTPDIVEARLMELDFQLPKDLPELFRIAGEFTLNDCVVHGLFTLRTVVLDEGEFVVLAERPNGSMLAIHRDQGEGLVYRLEPDRPPEVMGENFRDSLERFLGVS